ncbi:MAG: acyl-CoA dehydrogenase family protein, partial [Longimicrobiales bacterium]
MKQVLFYPDRDLPEELLRHAERVREFAREKLLPHARLVDEERRFRPETVTELAAAGILGGPIAVDRGGAGWSPLELVVAHEEIGAVCGNTRGFLAVQAGLVGGCLQAFGDETQKGTWLPRLARGEVIGCFALTEPDAGSDVAAIQTRAERHGDHYTLHGEKIWITNGTIAQLAVVFCTVDPAVGRDGLTAFLVDT